jgi:nicotinic acid mononucleotide adenylyltransferase
VKQKIYRGTDRLSPAYIWSGRFQPFHNGHLCTLQQIAKIADGGPVYLGVLVFAEGIASMPGDTGPLTTRADNPLSAFERWEMLHQLVACMNLPSPVIPICLPRTDTMWSIARDMLPPDRIICIVRRDRILAQFEAAKVERYRSFGETVRMVDVEGLPEISAGIVRQRVRNRLLVTDLIPAPIFDYLDRHELWGKLSSSGC